MNDSLDEKDRIRRSNKLKDAYDNFAAGVGYISIILPNGDESIGSCFHIGEGIFITARHVVENCKIKEIGTTSFQRSFYEIEESKDTGMVRATLDFTPQSTTSYQGPFMHPDENIDVAAIVVNDIKAPVLILGDHLDDWLGDEYVLSDVLIMGYPPIPFSSQPLLISSKCEVNTIIDKYTGGHPHFILSTMARGGFSGSPVITEEGIVLGVATESLSLNNQPTELGYLAIMSVEGIYKCIAHHKLIPKHIDEQWDGFWSKEDTWYQASEYEHVSVSLYDREDKSYVDICSYRNDILDIVQKTVNESFEGLFVLEKIHEQYFRYNRVYDENIKGHSKNLYLQLKKIVSEFGIPVFGGTQEKV